MSPVSLPPALLWAAPPVFGALLGLAAGRIAARFAVHRLNAGVRGTVTLAVPLLTAGLLEKPVADLMSDNPDVMVGLVRRSVESAVRSLVRTPSFLHAVRQSIASAVSSIWALPVSDLLSRVGARGFLVERLLPVLARTETRRAIARAAGAAARERSGPIIADDLLEGFSGPLGQFLPAAIERLIEWMESREMRDTMAERGRELLPRILEKLNVMQRLFLSAGQFDKRIDEKMPEIIEETLQALERIMRDPAQQSAMRDRILMAVRDWGAGKDSRRDAAQLVTDITDKYLQGLEEPVAREGVYRSLEAFLAEGGQTLGSLLRNKAGLMDSEVSDSLTNLLLAWMSGPDAAASLSSWVSATAADSLRENATGKLGLVLGIDVTRKKKIDAFLIEAATRIAAESGPRVAAAGRGRAMKWAGLAGSALGVAIGLVEDALRLFGAG